MGPIHKIQRLQGGKRVAARKQAIWLISNPCSTNEPTCEYTSSLSSAIDLTAHIYISWYNSLQSYVHATLCFVCEVVPTYCVVAYRSRSRSRSRSTSLKYFYTLRKYVLTLR